MDAVFKQKKLDFIKTQLSSYGGEKKEYGERVMIRCPFHNDGTPSGSLSLSQTWPGSFRCYACGTKASWDELAVKLQLQPFKRGEPKEEFAIDLVAAATQYFENKENYRKDKFKFSPLPKNKKWRGLSTNLLIELGGQLCVKWSDDYQSWNSTKFIHLPVTINDEQVGFFRARLKKEVDQPSYLNAAGKWSRTHGLFPFDHSIQMMKDQGSRSVVLVEGQRDALRLVSHGIPAMCIFGTQSISSKKLQHLECAGVKRLIILMDGDEAGIDATEKIKEIANPMFDEVRVIKLWNMKGSPYRQFEDHENPTKAAKEAGVEPWDPGNCPQRILDRIKAQYF
jgi:DNA primase